MGNFLSRARRRAMRAIGPTWDMAPPDSQDAPHDFANIPLTNIICGPAPRPDDVNPKDMAARDKVPMWSLPSIGAVHGAMSTGDGMRKGYKAYNWRDKPISMMEHIGAIERHIAALKDGEDYVTDGMASHLGCVISTASIILDAQQCGSLDDDRPTPGLTSAADALEDYRERNTES